MDPERPLDTPFSPEPGVPESPPAIGDAPPPSDPTDKTDGRPAPPDEPRLGILHLLIGTACVAVYLGLVQSAHLIQFRLAEELGPQRAESPLIVEVMFLLHSIAAGLALGGLVLWAARRFRGVRFPTYPGEYLLVVLGILSASSLAVRFLVSLGRAEPGLHALWQLGLFVTYLAGIVISLRAAALVKIIRWQGFFSLYAVSYFVACLSVCGGFRPFSPLPYLVHALIAVVLAVVVVRDRAQGCRYPWPHWLGVVIKFWFCGISLGWFLLFAFHPLYQDMWR